ncbi:MAG: helix-turn-helix transcriptional regulator [Bacillota bacterium]
MVQNNISRSLAAGQKLKSLIKTSQYRTQEEFAFAFSVNTRTVGRWVSEGINSLETIEQLADFFAIDFLDFLSL